MNPHSINSSCIMMHVTAATPKHHAQCDSMHSFSTRNPAPCQMWDICSQSRIRPLWHHYFEGASGIVFVVDAANRDRVDFAAEELERNVLSSPLLDGVPLLVFANKQDLPRALTPGEVGIRLGLEGHTEREWHVQASSAARVDGGPDGLAEGFAWLAEAAGRRLHRA